MSSLFLRQVPISAPTISPDEVFAASRLSLARERRGMTKKALAQALGLTADAITKFEKARCDPTPENVVRCADVLDFPLSWFYDTDLELLDPDAPSFRSRRSMTAELKLKATRAGDLAAHILSPFLHRQFHLPASRLPDLSGHTPEAAASYLRSQFGLGLGPISNMVHFLESVGVEVFWLEEADIPSLDAWSVWHMNRPFVLLNQHTDAGCRARFDAAHELGHLVLHRQEKIIDGLTLEKEANQFAAAFLMPPEQFFRECPKLANLRAFFPLKKRWGTSLAAMIMHCQVHGHFSEWVARRAFQDLSSHGWRLQEPKEIALVRETSALQPQIWLQIQNQGYNAQTVASNLKIGVRDLLEMMPAFRDVTLSHQRPQLRLL